MKVLTQEGEDLLDEFNSKFRSNSCSCHINPPCSYCTHPGNPRNLEEQDDLWVYNSELSKENNMEQRKFKIGDQVVKKESVNNYIAGYRTENFEFGNQFTFVNMVATSEKCHLIATSNGNNLSDENNYIFVSEVKSYCIRKLSERLIHISDFNFK